MPTITEKEIEVAQLTIQLKSLKNMFTEIMNILVKYEANDKGMLLNYSNIKIVLNACVNMQTQLITKIKDCYTSITP